MLKEDAGITFTSSTCVTFLRLQDTVQTCKFVSGVYVVTERHESQTVSEDTIQAPFLRAVRGIGPLFT